jgi:hypothetical protein
MKNFNRKPLNKLHHSMQLTLVLNTLPFVLDTIGKNLPSISRNLAPVYWSVVIEIHLLDF